MGACLILVVVNPRDLKMENCHSAEVQITTFNIICSQERSFSAWRSSLLLFRVAASITSTNLSSGLSAMWEMWDQLEVAGPELFGLGLRGSVNQKRMNGDGGLKITYFK